MPCVQKAVWEKLCDVSGNTEFASGNFSCLSGQPTAQDVTAAADLVQAAFSGVVSPQGGPGEAPRPSILLSAALPLGVEALDTAIKSVFSTCADYVKLTRQCLCQVRVLRIRVTSIVMESRANCAGMQ